MSLPPARAGKRQQEGQQSERVCNALKRHSRARRRQLAKPRSNMYKCSFMVPVETINSQHEILFEDITPLTAIFFFHTFGKIYVLSDLFYVSRSAVKS